MIDPFGIPNVSFSLDDENVPEEKRKQYKEQRITRGFDDTECWNLDFTISKFILPRLCRFKEINQGFPSSLDSDSWNKILDEMIEGFDLATKKFDWPVDPNIVNGNEEKVKRALSHFQKYFFDLWW